MKSDNTAVKTTPHLAESLRKRPHITQAKCEWVVAHAEDVVCQPNGRIAHYAQVDGHWLCVIVLEDGETLHTAYRDSNYRLPGH